MDNKKAPRSDGQATQEIILETAGKIFAKRGYAETTSKEICETAKVNIAAVNYYFGGKDGLYQAVLEEAHKRITNLEDVHEIYDSCVLPQDKLKSIISVLVKSSQNCEWCIKVLLNEALNRFSHYDGTIPASFFQEIVLLSEVISEILNLPLDSPKVKNGTSFTIMFCLGWLVLHEFHQHSSYFQSSETLEDTVDNITAFLLRGLI